MNKKVKVTSLAAAALTSVVLAGANLNHEVKADTVPEGTSAKAQSAQDNAQANVESAQKEVDSAQSDVNTAKSNLDSAQGSAQTADSAYNDQNSKAQAAQKNENDKKTALDKAQDAQKKAQQLVNDSKDSAKVKQANDDVTNKQTAVKTAQDAQKTADQKVSDQNKVVAGDQTAVDSATKVRDQKQTAKNQADAQVKTAEDALKGTGIAEAKDAKDKAEATVNQTASELKQTQAQRDELANKNADYAKLAKEVGNDQNLAQQKVDQAKKDTDAAIKKSNDLNQQLQKLNELNAELNRNNLKISDLDKYKKAFLDYYGDGLTADDIAYINAERSKPNNQYQSSEKDKQEVVSDVNNLSDEQIEDLSMFATHLINDIRRQFGWQDMVVTKGSLNFAKDVAQKYLSDLKSGKWSDGLKITQEGNTYIIDGSKSWHDVAGINNVSKDYGLGYNENGLTYSDEVQKNEDQYYEDAGGTLWKAPLTMDKLKESMFNTISSLIFPDGHGITSAGSAPEYEFGHAAGILKIEGDSQNGFREDIAFSKEDIDEGLNDIKTEINNFQDSIEDDKKTIASLKEAMAKDPSKAKELSSQIEEEEKELQEDISALASYQSDLLQYQLMKRTNNVPTMAVIPTYYETINVPVAGFDNSLYGENHILTLRPEDIEDPSKFDFTEVPSYEEQIEQNKKAQVDAKNELQKAQGMEGFATVLSKSLQLQNKLTSDTNAFHTASDNYNRLTASHDDKVKALKEADKAQEIAKTNLDDAQTKLNDAQKTLDDAKKNLETLQKDAQSKGDAVKQAQIALETAQKHVEDLKNAPQILKTANDAEAKAQTEYDAAKKAADEAGAQLKKLENEKSAADGQVATAQATYDEALARLKSAQDKLAKAKEALNNIQNDQKTISTPDQKPVEKKTTKTVKKTAKVTKKAKKVSSHVRLTHNAFVYTKSGKAIRSGLHFKLVRRGKTVKALKNAKIVTIKGKRFYQIGKNQFIKVANAKIVTHAVHVKAVIKGKKVRAYDRLGKLNKHSVKGGCTYTFNEKAVINGKTYYKIAWTNNWIPASKLNLKK